MATKRKTITIPKINLLPKDPFYDTIVGKAMVWATNVGRYIIVLTEVIVIISFASRFKLDRDLTDLTTSVTQKSAIVESYGDTERQMRLAQEKTRLVKTLLDQPTASSYIKALIAHIPADTQINIISYTPTELTVSGKSKSSGTISGLITILQTDPTFKGLTIDKIASSEVGDPTIEFSFRLALVSKEDKTKKAAPKPAAAPPSEEL